MNKFVSSVKSNASKTLTENGAFALSTTGSDLADLFAIGGSLREHDAQGVAKMLSLALDEDVLLATKLMFHIRNVRGGMGERKTFRAMLNWMGDNKPAIVVKNLTNIVKFGRWDDCYSLVGTLVEGEMWSFLYQQLISDIQNAHKGNPISLLAKWLKSTNTSSKDSVILGKMTASALGYTEKQYRQVLSYLRSYLKVVEVYMSSGEWTGIEYSSVPSNAMKNYRKAFGRHDADGFGEYIESVKKGEKKIKAATLFPHDIFLAAGLRGSYGSSNYKLYDWDDVLEEQWKALPNYVAEGSNVLVVADTSASMLNPGGVPMAVALGLAIYFAERNTGDFKNLFMTFSSNPEFVLLKGKTLKEKVAGIKAIVSNTNLERTFDLILSTAVNHGLAQEDMPKAVVIISDMQFDGAVEGNKLFHRAMAAKFARAGYVIPHVVYWSVRDCSAAFQGSATDNGVVFVSGASPSAFKAVLKTIGGNTYDAILETLNDEMYDSVVV